MLNNNKKGFSLIELIIAISAFSLLASGVFSSIIGNYEGFYGIGDKQALAEYAQEGIEAVRAIRDRSWQLIEGQVASNTGLLKTDGLWGFDGSNNTSGSLTRVILISNISRDGSGNIVSSGGTDDPDTKLLKVTVSGSGMTDYILEEFLTNWDYKIWEQTDWSGSTGASFWYDITKYDTKSNIDHTTTGEIKLSTTFDDWSDLTSDADISLSSNTYDLDFSSDGNTAYIVGNTIYDFGVYDISSARSGTITETSNSISLANTAYSIVVYPGANVAYIGYYFKRAPRGTPEIISVVDLGSNVLETGITPSYFSTYDLVIGDKIGAADYLFALANDGYIYAYSINGSTGALTSVGSTSITASAINNGYFDASTETLYVVTDDNSKEFISLDVSSPGSIRENYSCNFSGNDDVVDLKYLGLNGSNLQFLLLRETTASLIHDIRAEETTHSGCTSKDTLNLAVNTFKGLAYDGDDMALAYNQDGYVYNIDVSDITNLSTSLNSDYDGAAKLPYNSMQYNSTLGGAFFLKEYLLTKKFHFIKQPEIYNSSGTATSSVFDLGSTNQEIHGLETTQNIPTSCTIDITLEVDDNSSFTSPSTETYSLSGSSYTSSTNSSLHNERWLRYKASLASCSSNANSPTLNSLKIKYE